MIATAVGLPPPCGGTASAMIVAPGTSSARLPIVSATIAVRLVTSISTLLLPWRTVLENVTLGPELAGRPLAQARAGAIALLRRFGLEGFENAYPAALSGGMRQRAALLRTILCERPLILLDEPFGALDALTRASMHEWLLGIQREFQRTMILITHDPDEAVFLSDRVYVASPRPMRIAGTVAIDLGRSRTRDAALTPAFAAHKRQVLDLLHTPDNGRSAEA